MKKSFFKIILSACILLTSIYSPLFAHSNIEHTSFELAQPVKNTSTNNQESVVKSDAVLKSSLDNLDKVIEIEAVEIGEEESEHSNILKDIEQQYSTASFYLLSVLFLFSYFTDSNTLHKLFNFLPTADRRFVLYQVFRI